MFPARDMITAAVPIGELKRRLRAKGAIVPGAD